MFKKIATYGLVAIIALGNGPMSFAVDWDDAGNSASKLWDDNGNWSPDGDPDGQAVVIGNLANATNDRTLVDRFYSIDSLAVSNGADVVNSTTNGVSDDFELIVNGATTVTGAGSSIIIYGGDPDGLDTNTLTINNGGSVIVNSTTNSGTAVVEVDSGLFAINVGGSLTGTGRIDLEDNPGALNTLLRNDGTITANTSPLIFGFAPNVGTLQITATSANALFDWDGTSGIGVLNVNGNQTLDIDVSTGTDAFGGTMNLSTGSTLDIADAWALNSGTINVNTAAFGFIIIGQDPNPGAAAVIAGANWTMTGGTINILDSWDSLQLDSQLVASGGTIENSGHMIFNGGATIQSGVNFDMNGGDAALTINSAVNIDTPDFNLDGQGLAGNVTTINAGGILDLDLGLGADEDFHHTINMNGGELDVSTTDNDWSLASSGEINAAGGVVSSINGEIFDIHGDINVTANSELRVNAGSAYSSTADVVIDAGSTLNHNSIITYSGGSFTGGGIFRKGNATILSDTTWSVATVDIDDGSTSVENGAALVVNTDSIDDFGDGIDQTITVEDTGQLTLNINDGSDVVFDNAGRLVYNGNNVSSTFLPTPASGSALVFTNTSELNINGDGTSNARIELNGGTLNINDVGEDFRMNGGSQIVGSTNEISGGTINGPGELQIGSARALRGNGTINAQVDGDGSAQLIASDGLLSVNGGIEDIGTIGTSGAAAVLHVTDPWNTSVTEAVVLDRGRIQGSTITNNGVNGITGHGAIISRVNNNSLIQANGGLLIVDNNLNDWDGTANTGTLRASGSTLELRDNASFLFNGTVEANSGTVFASGFELEFEPGSMLRLNEGVYSSDTATDFGGDIEVMAGAASIIQVTASSTFENTSSTILNDTLRLEDGHSFVEVGAAFAGGGVLLNAGSHILTLEDGSNVGVLVENEGLLTLGASPGQATVLDYQQDAIGTLEIELAGTGLNDFDRLTATGLMQLDGLLELSLLGGFNPALSDSFTVLSAAAGVNGVFSLFDFSAASLDPGLMWDVIYNPTNVQLEVVALPSFTADFDNDGDVDGDDLTQWEGDYGGPGSDADSDGDSDGFDFLAWQQQFGSGVPVVAALGAAAVPEPSTLFLAGLAGCFGLLVTRRKK